MLVQQRLEVHCGLGRAHGVDEVLHVDKSIFDLVDDLLVRIGGGILGERVAKLIQQVEKKLKQVLVHLSELVAGRTGRVVEAFASGLF